MSERLEVRSLSHVFPHGEGRLKVLDKISFKLKQGEFLALVGPSGCGKTTLLRLIGGLLRPTKGEISFVGRLGFVFQERNLMPWRTVKQNLALPLEILRESKHEIHQRVNRILRMTGLKIFGDTFPQRLSGGMEQLVALGRSLVCESDLLLLDEPFGNLDMLTRQRMNQRLLKIVEQSKQSVVMVTHSVEEAVMMADKVLLLSPRPGRILKTFKVPFKRPRQIELLSNHKFGQLVGKIRAILLK